MQISPILRTGEGDRLLFWCPACSETHFVAIGHGEGPRWTWNGRKEAPTFNPSVLVRSRTWDPPVGPDNIDAYRDNPWVQTQVETVCHFFVTDGSIQFLADCTHDLAGFTIQMVTFPDGE